MFMYRRKARLMTLIQRGFYLIHLIFEEVSNNISTFLRKFRLIINRYIIVVKVIIVTVDTAVNEKSEIKTNH